MRTAPPRDALILIPLAAALLLAALLSLTLGRYSALSPGQVLAMLVHSLLPALPITPSWSSDAATVVWSVRLPRVLAAILTGAALSASGAAFQGIFRNPLVAPDILGVSTGAGLGAALAILCALPPLGVQSAAFACGLLAVAATCLLGSWRADNGDAALVLILSGVIVGTVFSACVSLIKLTADPDNVLPAVTFWLMGSLAQAAPRNVLLAAPPILAGLAVLHLLRWSLNALSFGDDEARTLGLDARRVRLAVIVTATLMTASSVAISGVIGLAGLIAPHMARLLAGPNYRTLLPASALTGALFLLLVDGLARTLFVAEIPLGILTSLVGAPIFLYLLTGLRRSWQS